MKQRTAGLVGAMTLLVSGSILFARGSSEEASHAPPEAAPTAGREAVAQASDDELPSELRNQSPPRGAGEFSTDFSRATVSFDDIISGGPGKDDIPAIDRPRFVAVRQADEWLEDSEAVFVVSAGGETHIHPVQILMWHEIANDVVGGVPITVTYCPLCNTGVAFLREFNGRTLDFGVSGRLRFSNMIMYDRQTETWWQQATGGGIAGRFAGTKLDLHPMLMLSWSVAAARYPDAQVLSRDTGYSRSYGVNPYRGYDSSSTPFLYRGPAVDDEFSPTARVLSIDHRGESDAVPYPILRERGVVSLEIGGDEVVVFWKSGTASAIDAGSVAGGRDVGTANAFLSRLDNDVLQFENRSGRIVDTATESEWDITGRAVSGPLAGAELEPVVTIQHLWFSWTAFDPG